jgi:hypothetical protein
VVSVTGSLELLQEFTGVSVTGNLELLQKFTGISLVEAQGFQLQRYQ